MTEEASSAVLPSEEILDAANESGSGSGEPELRPSDLQDTGSLKNVVDACDAEKSPSLPVEDEVMVSPESLDAKEAEKTEAVGGGAAALPRLKKRSVNSAKTGAKVAWGKLISQCSQVYALFHSLHDLNAIALSSLFCMLLI